MRSDQLGCVEGSVLPATPERAGSRSGSLIVEWQLEQLHSTIVEGSPSLRASSGGQCCSPRYSNSTVCWHVGHVAIRCSATAYLLRATVANGLVGTLPVALRLTAKR